MRRAGLIVLLFVAGAAAATAQQPTVANSAVAARGEPLPVYDDDGVIIPEQMIVETMEPRLGGVMRSIIRVTSGWVGAAYLQRQAAVHGRDCSIYEPCSEQEKWRMSAAPWFGFAIGVLLSYVALPGGYDRQDAVERIRAERRLAKARAAR